MAGCGGNERGEGRWDVASLGVSRRGVTLLVLLRTRPLSADRSSHSQRLTAIVC